MFCPIQLLVAYRIQFSYSDLVVIIRLWWFFRKRSILDPTTFYWSINCPWLYFILMVVLQNGNDGYFATQKLAGWDHFVDKVLIRSRSRTVVLETHIAS